MTAAKNFAPQPTSRFSRSSRLADGFDFHEQVLAADIGLQVDNRSRGVQKVGQGCLDSRQIGWFAHVDLELQIIKRVVAPAEDAIGFLEQGGDVDHGFASLRDDIAAMNGFMTDNAGGAGNE